MSARERTRVHGHVKNLASSLHAGLQTQAHCATRHRRYGACSFSRLESFATAEDVSGRHLSLPLRHHPMLNPDALTCVGIGPPRDVARSEDARHARFEVLVHGDPAVDGQAGSLGQVGQRSNPDAKHQEVRVDRR